MKAVKRVVGDALDPTARRVVAWVRLHRHRFPAPLQRLLNWARYRVPRRWVARVHPIGRVAEPVVTPLMDRPQPPSSDVRLYVAPANFAGQGYLWSRAAQEHVPGVGGIACTFLDDRGLNFEVDYRVPVEVYAKDRRWQQEQFAYVADNFSHVLAEAARPLFGNFYGRDPVNELVALRDRGLQVAMIAHGTDARLPSRHALDEPWSPFRDDDWSELPLLQFNAEKTLGFYARFDGPTYVSTVDLLDDLPGARWCPVIVDVRRWARPEDPFQDDAVVKVVHAPSRSHIKGSTLVDPIMQRLAEASVVDYARLAGIPAQQMPRVYGGADIVLDQFRLGSYGVAACEAMAAGRLVIGHVSSRVREHVAAATGRELPILEATPDTLEEVIGRVVEDREWARGVAASGPAFVKAVHDGRYSASVLSAWLTA